MEDKLTFIAELQKLVNMTRAFDELIIEVGYRDIQFGNFIQSTERLEWLLLRWPDQDSKFARLVPIEGDSCWGIMIDFMKIAAKWR